MANKPAKIKIKCDANDLEKVISELNLYFRDFGKFYSRLQKLLLDIKNVPSKSSKLICVQSSTTSRTTVTVTLKPTQLFLDILSACRTGKFNNVFVNADLHKKHSKTKGL